MLEFTGERFVPQIDGNIKYEHLHRYALAIELAKGRSVLDIASGEGYGSALLANHAASVTGVDIDVESVDHARVQYGHFANLNFLVGSCDAIPLADSSIDLVTSFETIEHHDRHEEMMQEIKRVLNLDGLLIISSPNRLVYSDEQHYTNPFHVKELYYQEFLDLLKQYFQHIHIYGQKLAINSCITPLKPSNKQKIKSFSGDVNSLANFASYFSSPMYFVAVYANRAELLPENLESIYLDESDDLLKKLQDDGNAYRLKIQEIQSEKDELQQTIQEIQSTKNELQQTIQKLQQDIQQQQISLKSCMESIDRSNNTIQWMETSKFWQLRNHWLKLKVRLKLDN
jgi:ubiquinone/menaquinone biosynthesis C-methylase UbiE/FtsZ-binding cell division protein ZapB